MVGRAKKKSPYVLLLNSKLNKMEKRVGLLSMEQTVGLLVARKVADVTIVVRMVFVALEQNITSMEIALKKCLLL